MCFCSKLLNLKCVTFYLQLHFPECKDQFWCKYIVDLPNNCIKEKEMEGCPTKCVAYLPKDHRCFKKQGALFMNIIHIIYLCFT